MDKAQLERMYKHNLKVKKVLFIISMALFGVATALIFAVIILRINGVDVLLIPEFLSYEYYLSNALLDLFSTCLAGGIMTLLFSTLIFSRRAVMAKVMLDNYDQIKQEQARMWKTMPSEAPIVDVKEAPQKGKYDDLIKEYQKLCDQGLITKEELEQKKKDLGYKN